VFEADEFADEGVISAVRLFALGREKLVEVQFGMDIVLR